jgi:hypothetical protein
MTTVLPESKPGKISISSHEKNVLYVIYLFFGYVRRPPGRGIRQAEDIHLVRAAPAERARWIDGSAATAVLTGVIQSAGAAQPVPRT